MQRLVVLAVIMAALLITVGCSVQSKPHKESRFLMDTLIEITAYGPEAPTAIQDAFAQFERLHAMANVYDPSSQVAKVNEAAGVQPVTVDSDLIVMVERSRELSDMLGGTFDISVGPLTELWGVGKKGDYVPTDNELAPLLPLVDYHRIQVDKQSGTLYLPMAGMRLDMGGIAKGYATDKAIERLKAKGIKSALVNAGGNVRVIGTRNDGKAWRIGIQHPRDEDRLAAKLALTAWDTMETSGDYQRYFIKDAVRYAHIIDPRTGRQPGGVASVTVMLNKSADGDIFSTALFILGPEKGMAALEKFPGVEAVWVTADGRIVATPGLQGKLEL